MQKDYFDRVHRWGILWNIGALLALLCIPVAVCLHFNVWPEGEALLKIMPKLRGVEVSGEYEDIIDDIAKIIQDKIPELVNDFTKAKSLPSKLFMWHSAEFLEN